MASPRTDKITFRVTPEEKASIYAYKDENQSTIPDVLVQGFRLLSTDKKPIIEQAKSAAYDIEKMKADIKQYKIFTDRVTQHPLYQKLRDGLRVYPKNGEEVVISNITQLLDFVDNRVFKDVGE